MIPYAFIRFIDLVFQALYLALFVRVLLSWIPHNRFHPIVELLYRVTDPMLRPFQDLVPSHRIGIDLSPLFAFFALGVLKRLVFYFL